MVLSRCNPPVRLLELSRLDYSQNITVAAYVKPDRHGVWLQPKASNVLGRFVGTELTNAFSRCRCSVLRFDLIASNWAGWSWSFPLRFPRWERSGIRSRKPSPALTISRPHYWNLARDGATLERQASEFW